jgi:hypothetical protein
MRALNDPEMLQAIVMPVGALNNAAGVVAAFTFRNMKSAKKSTSSTWPFTVRGTSALNSVVSSADAAFCSVSSTIGLAVATAVDKSRPAPVSGRKKIVMGRSMCRFVM